MKFSASMISTWMKCPLQAKFGYVERLPQLQNAAASFGTCVHDALEQYNADGDIQAAVNRFLLTWENPEMLDRAPDIWPKRMSYSSLRETGVKILLDYHEGVAWSAREVIGAEHKFCVPFGDHLLSGIVDLLEYIPKQPSGTLKIIDYKAQPLDARVLTPSGWTTIGELEIGDIVTSADGSSTTVEGVYPQGWVDAYRVTFTDGASTICSGEHLWRTVDVEGHDTVQKLLDLNPLRRGGNHRYFVPTCGATEQPEADLPLHPYLMGILIAEGCFTGESVMVSNGDEFILDKIRGVLPDGTELVHASNHDYRLREGRGGVVHKTLRSLGLWGKSSLVKSIPEIYLRSSVEQRKELLAGLVDGDGSSSNRNQYRTSSPALKDGFVELCRSLGGTPYAKEHPSWYPTADGGRKICAPSWHVSIRTPFNPFSLPRKAEGWHSPKQRLDRAIAKIEPLNLQLEMVCIKVAADDGLYVTDDYIVTHNTSGYRPNYNSLYLNIQFCADDQTEILTRRGWKKHNEILVGEDVLTLNQASGIAEWEPAIDVHTFQAIDQDLVSLEGKAHSSLTTENHRWPVRHRVCGKNGWYMENRIVESGSLSPQDSILCAAPVVNLPVEAKYSDAFVELLAWFWTEGHWTARQGSPGASIAQSEMINPEKVARIRSVLTQLYGPPVATLHSLRGTDTPGWRETPSLDCTRFYLNPSATLPLLSEFTDTEKKVVAASFISHLTEAQLRLFVDVSIMADGSTQNGCRIITQAVRERLDPLQMACSLMGVRTSLGAKVVGGDGPYAGREYWSLSLKDRSPFFTPAESTRSTKRYTGIVWCPRTKNQTWFARRNGQVYFTGNTIYYYASLQPEFWMGYDDGTGKYPGMANGEEMFDRFKDVKRQAIWSHLRTNKEFDCGPRDDMDFMRLYRCCEEIRRALEHEVFVPNISGDTCTLCAFTDSCGAFIPPIVAEGQLS